MTSPIDYERLLAKYIAHIDDCEGIDYINSAGEPGYDVEFTPDEIAALQRMSSEAQEQADRQFFAAKRGQNQGNEQ